MCDAFEWLEWQMEDEQRIQREKADALKKQSAVVKPVESAQPEKQQQEPVPA